MLFRDNEHVAVENGPVVQESDELGLVEDDVGRNGARDDGVEYAFLRERDITLLACRNLAWVGRRPKRCSRHHLPKPKMRSHERQIVPSWRS